MLGSLQDAEDTIQEVLLAAWVWLDGFQERSSFRTWLHRITTNRCLTGSDFLMDGGVTASYFYGELAPQ